MIYVMSLSELSSVKISVRFYSNNFPPQILAMIEEAAGTRMYECKKISAQKTIEKKEAKLKEIQTVCQIKCPVHFNFT